jgi:hypothetical protein
MLHFEGMMTEPNGGSSSGQGLVATQKRFGTATEHRTRLHQGTKHAGTQDLEWAVQQIKDRRFQILEAGEVLTEVMDRFYEDDDYFC